MYIRTILIVYVWVGFSHFKFAMKVSYSWCSFPFSTGEGFLTCATCAWDLKIYHTDQRRQDIRSTTKRGLFFCMFLFASCLILCIFQLKCNLWKLKESISWNETVMLVSVIKIYAVIYSAPTQRQTPCPLIYSKPNTDVNTISSYLSRPYSEANTKSSDPSCPRINILAYFITENL